MLRNVFTKSLWDQRRGIVGWSIAIALVGVTYAAFYPSINSPEMAAALEAYPQGLLDALGFTDITSPAGYLGSTTYGILGPILAIIFGASLGARAIAGEEEGGRLDVLMAHPVERWSVVIQRAGAIVVALTLAGVVLFVAVLLVSGPADLGDVGAANIAAATVQLVLLAAAFAMLALAVGALTGSRGLSLGAVALVAVATYFANTLGPTIDAIAWTQDLSPFHYFSGGQPLVNGLQVGDALVLAVTSAVLVVVAMVGFVRRDIAV
jgi:ABC-2 type transport system permease protein